LLLAGLGAGVVVAVVLLVLLSGGTKNKSRPPSAAKKSGGQPPSGKPPAGEAKAPSGSMTYAEAYALPLGTSYGAVVSRFGAPPPKPSGQPSRIRKSHCVYYTYIYEERDQGTFRLCFGEGSRGLLTIATLLQ
jgi:hypothetical protein